MCPSVRYSTVPSVVKPIDDTSIAECRNSSFSLSPQKSSGSGRPGGHPPHELLTRLTCHLPESSSPRKKAWSAVESSADGCHWT